MDISDTYSEKVQILQEDLIEHGYNLGAKGADGRYGANTANAVREFQRDHNLTVDGKAGPDTKKALYYA